MLKFKAGAKAYIVESNRYVTAVTIVRCSGGMYLIRFESGGGIQVKEHRLYESAEAVLESITPKNENQTRSNRIPYDYM